MIRPSPDRSFRPGRIKRSGLKRNQRISKNHQEMHMHDDADDSLGQKNAPHRPPRDAPTGTPRGWSLRWDQPLSPEDVEATEDVLRRMGIDLPVRRRIAESLAPAEAWSLWVYADAKRWRLPLTISRVYDKTSRQAQAATDLNASYDAVGHQLAALHPDDAEAAVRLVARCCPDDPQAVLEAATSRGENDRLHPAIRAVWAMVADLRGWRGDARENRLDLYTGRAACYESNADVISASTWTTALGELRRQLTADEYETWITQASLLQVEHDRVIVGTPNIFVRDHLDLNYKALLGATLHNTLGRAVDVQVVIA
jgi:hypothetical protein